MGRIKSDQIIVKGYRASLNRYLKYIHDAPKASHEPLSDNLKADKWGRAVTVAKLFPKGVHRDAEERVYRIKEGYGWVQQTGALGRYPPKPDNIPNEYSKVFDILDGDVGKCVTKDNTTATILVINDDNHVFRHLNTRGASTETNPNQISADDVVNEITRSDRYGLILAMAEPLAEGKIWNLIKDNEKLLKGTAIIVSAAALRFHGLNIRQRGAVETTAHDLVRHVQPGTVLSKLMKCKHVLVRDLGYIILI